MKPGLDLLLRGAIDYAGMFPPAALSVDEAVRNYQKYASGPYSWMLGRLIVTAEAAQHVPEGIPISAVGARRVPNAEAVEIRWDGQTELPPREPHLEIYVEGPCERLAAVKASGHYAKIRTGGVDEELIPSVTALKDFVDHCAQLQLPFKATAGLHHPVRGSFPLTYEHAAPRATMHGFLNLMLYVLTGQEQLLSETNPAALDIPLAPERVKEMRQLFRSFGSCSFEEPVEGLRELGWIS